VNRRNIGIGCGGLLLIVLLIGLFAPSPPATPATVAPAAVDSGGDAESAPVDDEQPAAAEAEDEGEQVFAIGTAVSVPPFGWQVESAEDLGQQLTSDNQFIDPMTTSGRFIRVNVGVLNDGDDATMVLLAPKVVDSRGREFDPASDAFMHIPTEMNCALENLNPGIATPCVYIYEVPADATGLKLRVNNQEIFGSAEADIDLGLD
jgi:hypothetical protein